MANINDIGSFEKTINLLDKLKVFGTHLSSYVLYPLLSCVRRTGYLLYAAVGQTLMGLLYSGKWLLWLISCIISRGLISPIVTITITLIHIIGTVLYVLLLPLINFLTVLYYTVMFPLLLPLKLGYDKRTDLSETLLLGYEYLGSATIMGLCTGVITGILILLIKRFVTFKGTGQAQKITLQLNGISQSSGNVNSSNDVKPYLKSKGAGVTKDYSQYGHQYLDLSPIKQLSTFQPGGLNNPQQNSLIDGTTFYEDDDGYGYNKSSSNLEKDYEQRGSQPNSSGSIFEGSIGTIIEENEDIPEDSRHSTSIRGSGSVFLRHRIPAHKTLKTG